MAGVITSSGAFLSSYSRLDPHSQLQSKRRKTDHHIDHDHDQDLDFDSPAFAPESPAWRYEDYSVAWICALHIELAASLAVLDSLHPSLPSLPHDSNAYTLGNIKHHGIVLACLPTGIYGPVEASNLMTNMKHTFPNLRFGLMVGIGGGAPGVVDVRLGDIVVGTRVMQCDIGKIVTGGRKEPTIIPRLPGTELLKIVSHLRAKHELKGTRVPSILDEKLRAHSEYAMPRQNDHLFQADYSHLAARSSCADAGCEEDKLLSRSKRPSSNPVIHYGGVASGSEVMRESKSRDAIARQLDVICFEMEAAGLMGIIPCLPIRGICDYADSHKDKTWQRYAAAVAAAYARELLEETPRTSQQVRHEVGGAVEDGSLTTLATNDLSGMDLSKAQLRQQRQELLKVLRFEAMSSRRINIASAHAKTCEWFYETEQYQSWLDPSRCSEHRGLAWIRGKPGSGKSTLMKFLHARRKAQRSRGTVVASHFFNARGEGLERSILGMYRSLLVQLLEGFSDLQEVLDDSDLATDVSSVNSLNNLKDLLSQALSRLQGRSFICYVDALDECDEQQVMDMIMYFEALATSINKTSVSFHMCFSSRHYPYIEIKYGVRLILEDQPGHKEDLTNFIREGLRVSDDSLVEEILPQLLEKAAGVFLWVILVVSILNKESRDGTLRLQDMKSLLAGVPSDLSDLFRTILKRDQDKMDLFLLSVLWLLCSSRPLTPTEYYHALDPDSRDGRTDTCANAANTGEFHCRAMAQRDILRLGRFVISSSKGLAEITRSQPTVQFIHESVRDFLVKDRGLYELWPELGLEWETLGHEELKKRCATYLQDDCIRNKITLRSNYERLLNDKYAASRFEGDYPLLKYAAQNVLYHADAAAKAIPQFTFLKAGVNLRDWIRLTNIFEQYKSRRYHEDTTEMYIYADNGHARLIEYVTGGNDAEYTMHHDPHGRFLYSLVAAGANGHSDAVAMLAGMNSGTADAARALDASPKKPTMKDSEGRNPLTWAIINQQWKLGMIILDFADVNKVDARGDAPMACALKFEGSVEEHQALLLEIFKRGAAFHRNYIRQQRSLLHYAATCGHESLARLALEEGDYVNEKGPSGSTPLHIAAKKGSLPLVRCLLDHGGGLKERDREGSTPVHVAGKHGHESIVRLFLDQGANVHDKDPAGLTPLHMAASHGFDSVVRAIVEKGGYVNKKDANESTALHSACLHRHHSTASLLIDLGANLTCRNSSGSTAFHVAILTGQERLIKLLIEAGANPIVERRDGMTPLELLIEAEQDDLVNYLLTQMPKTGARLVKRKFMNLLGLGKVNQTMIRQLTVHGRDINASDQYKRTALHIALMGRRKDNVRMLLELHADINTRDHQGFTPFNEAIKWGDEEVVLLCIQAGADINGPGLAGNTPLHCAATYGHDHLIDVLLREGADIDLRNTGQKTPYDLALHCGCVRVAKRLAEKRKALIAAHS